MSCWTSISKEEFYLKLTELKDQGIEVELEFSYDKKICTYKVKGTPYVQKQEYFNNTGYYQNSIVYSKKGI